MLQRVQVIYLLIIVAFTVATLLLPLAVLQQGDALFSFDASELNTAIGEPELLYPTQGLLALTAIVAIITSVTISLYKKGVLQIRLCVSNALLILDFYGFFAFLIYSLKGGMEGTSVSVKITFSFPLANLTLDYLAIRNVGADETLVRSLDYLR